MKLILLPGELAIARLDPQEDPPPWAKGEPLVAIIRTARELTVVCPASGLPSEVPASRGWRALEVQGPLSFDLVGILASLLEPLAREGVSVFALSTYDTDLHFGTAGRPRESRAGAAGGRSRGRCGPLTPVFQLR